MDPGEDFLTNLITGQNKEPDPGQNDNDGENDPIDDDTSQFSSASLDELAARDIFRNF